MKVLVIGSGGREHALVWKLRRSGADQVYCVPGNAGIAMEASCIPGDILSPGELANLAETLRADLTVVGPEAPLAAGVVDEFQARGQTILGPTLAAAQLESSKIFAKEFCQQHQIPTAEFALLESPDDVDRHIARFGFPVALKADGLASGKGVVIATSEEQARQTAIAMLEGQVVGKAGRRIVLERFLEGLEASFIILSDGKDYDAFPATRDHKRAFDDDQGPNTGGMGAYCSPEILTDALRQEVIRTVVEPTLQGMRDAASPFRGFLYCGLMLTADGPSLLEFNVRLGDPETQPLTYKLSSDTRFADVLLSAAQGRLAGRCNWKPDCTACVVLASKGYPGKYPKGLPIRGLPEAEAAGVKVFHAGTLLREGTPVTAGGRVLGVTAAGPTLADAVRLVYSGVERIDFDGCHYRQDIGKKAL